MEYTYGIEIPSNSEKIAGGLCGLLFDDAQGALSCLQKWRICHVRGSGNEATHRAAKEAISLSDKRVLYRKFLSISLILFLLSVVHKLIYI
jgi:hypothetical protein